MKKVRFINMGVCWVLAKTCVTHLPHSFIHSSLVRLLSWSEVLWFHFVLILRVGCHFMRQKVLEAILVLHTPLDMRLNFKFATAFCAKANPVFLFVEIGQQMKKHTEAQHLLFKPIHLSEVSRNSDTSH